MCYLVALFSQINEAIIDEHWSFDIQEELNQFERKHVWEIVPKASANLVIET